MRHDDSDGNTPNGVSLESGNAGDAGDGRTPDQTAEPSSRRRFLRYALAAAGVAAVGGLVVWFLVIPNPWTLRTTNPERTSLMEQRIDAASEAGDSLVIDQQWVPLEEISDNLVRAVIVAEDYRFRLHEGVDWVSLAEEVHWTGGDTLSWTRPSDLAALAEAARYIWTNRAEIRGRSTLTQQLAKNLYYGTDRSLARKVLEYVVAGRLERRLDKDRILELYLNVVEWGPGIFGAEAASQHYFGRPAASLTLEQAAALAGTLPHPLTSNPAQAPGRMTWRKNLILDRLDPSRGLPATPMPLPDTRLDFDAGIPEPTVRPLGPDGVGRVGTPIDSVDGQRFDSGVVTSPDSEIVVPVDTNVTAPVDTARRDTIPG